MKTFFYSMYFIYILYSENFDRYYIGSCENLLVRVQRHNSRGVPSTKAYMPWKLVYKEDFLSRADALKREKEIKDKKSKKYIEYLLSKSGGGAGSYVPI